MFSGIKIKLILKFKVILKKVFKKNCIHQNVPCFLVVFLDTFQDH